MMNQEFVDLARELKAGDNKRLKVIFEENASYCIRKLTSKHSCPVEDAEDIYTDAILNFRNKMISGEIQFLTDLRSYLYATCRNMFFAKLKKEERTTRAANEIYRGTNEWLNDEEDLSVYHEKIRKMVIDALSTIPEKCQQLLRAFYFDRMSLEEIAKRFEFASANVAKVSKSRCYKKLIDQVRYFGGEKMM